MLAAGSASLGPQWTVLVMVFSAHIAFTAADAIAKCDRSRIGMCGCVVRFGGSFEVNGERALLMGP